MIVPGSERTVLTFNARVVMLKSSVIDINSDANLRFIFPSPSPYVGVSFLVIYFRNTVFLNRNGYYSVHPL